MEQIQDARANENTGREIYNRGRNGESANDSGGQPDRQQQRADQQEPYGSGHSGTFTRLL